MKNNLIKLIGVSLMLLFFYTASAKLLNLGRFESELANQTLPAWSLPALLWIIPALELLVVFFLITPRLRLIGFYGSAVLMLVFTIYMGMVLLNVFDRVPCSCGGVLKHMGFKVHFVFNLLFLLLSVAGIWLIKISPNPGVYSTSDVAGTAGTAALPAPGEQAENLKTE